MSKFFAGAFWALIGAALALSVHSANSISNNLTSMEARIDRMTIMIDEMSKNATHSNKILKELTDGQTY